MSDKILFQSKYFRVLEIEVERKGKKFTKDLIERNPSVYILPLSETNELYLEMQYRDAFGKEILEVVAGTIEHDDDPLETAKRELLEETGLSATDWQPIISGESGVNMRSKTYIYVARGLTQGKATPDDDEILKVIKMPLEVAVEKAMNGEIISMPHLAGILKLDKLVKEGKL